MKPHFQRSQLEKPRTERLSVSLRVRNPCYGMRMIEMRSLIMISRTIINQTIEMCSVFLVGSNTSGNLCLCDDMARLRPLSKTPRTQIN